MIVWRLESRAARAAWIATGLAGADLAGDHAQAAFTDAPVDPATASAWVLWRCSICGANARPNWVFGEAVGGSQFLDHGEHLHRVVSDGVLACVVFGCVVLGRVLVVAADAGQW